MTIKSLHLKNFKSIGELKLDIKDDEKIICFVGENGSSKTSILNMIVDAFISPSPINFPDYNNDLGKRYRFITSKEIANNESFYKFNINYHSLDAEYFYNRYIVDRDNPNEDSEQICRDNHISGDDFYSEIITPDQNLQNNFFNKNVFIFRPSYRHEHDGLEVANSFSDQDFNTSIKSRDNKFFPYKFKVTHSGKDIERTIIELILDSFIGYEDCRDAFYLLPAILKKITKKDYGNFQVTRNPYRKLVSSTIGYVDNFSQGELDLLVTITSIMERQLYIYNQNNFSGQINSFLEVPGIVIIDEVDLHLHPKAQETYLKILRDTFKNIQFFVTTHSPFVIRGLPSNSIVIQLPTAEIINNDFSTMDIDSISNHIFNLSGRFKEDVENDLENFRLMLSGKNVSVMRDIYQKYKHSPSVKNELDNHLSLLPFDLVVQVIE